MGCGCKKKNQATQTTQISTSVPTPPPPIQLTEVTLTDAQSKQVDRIVDKLNQLSSNS